MVLAGLAAVLEVGSIVGVRGHRAPLQVPRRPTVTAPPATARPAAIETAVEVGKVRRATSATTGVEVALAATEARSPRVGPRARRTAAVVEVVAELAEVAKAAVRVAPPTMISRISSTRVR